MKSNFKIPIVDLAGEYNFLKNDIEKELKDCLKTQAWVLGPKVIEFEKKVANYLEVKHAIGVASGTDALLLSLRALALKIKGKEYFDKRDEIITTPLTFIATAEAIIRSGATPVFVDIDPDTFNIDPFWIKKAVTKNTVGILPVHLYGLACNMGEILRIAKEYNLFVLEDTAQAFGSLYKNKKLGTIGDLGAFSFFPSKNLGCFGDGGLIATNNKRLANLIRVLRNHGQLKRYNAVHTGYNSRLDSIQAAVLLAKLRYVDKLNRLRRRVAEKYNQGLKDIREIKTPYNPPDSWHVYHLYTIKVTSKRGQLLNFLNSSGIDARIYYPVLISKMRAFRDCKVKGKLRNAINVSKKILTLPIHPFLKEKEVQRIILLIRRFFRTGARS
ncbi:MAG: DegT/DnrJ/EryC1/StrS family aminotransferase [Candidatus Omnitrophica bacterium]|nr:DegT/DnrJ/EryC1/StrS family aminotransferase [Candidatus Omnitrophota bacterium]